MWLGLRWSWVDTSLTTSSHTTCPQVTLWSFDLAGDKDDDAEDIYSDHNLAGTWPITWSNVCQADIREVPCIIFPYCWSLSCREQSNGFLQIYKLYLCRKGSLPKLSVLVHQYQKNILQKITKCDVLYLILFIISSGLFVVVSWISFVVPPEVIPGRMVGWSPILCLTPFCSGSFQIPLSGSPPLLTGNRFAKKNLVEMGGTPLPLTENHRKLLP